LQTALVALAVVFLAFAFHCDTPWFERHVFLPQQYFIVADHRIVGVVRGAAAVVGLVLLGLVRLVPRGAGARRVALAALLAIPATEALLEWRSRRLLAHELVAATDSLTAKSARYGQTLRPSIDHRQRMSGRDVRFVTDGEGRRIGGAPVDRELPSLVVTGESTVAGHGLEWEETFPVLLGARLGLQVVNLASLAYRTDQSWLRLRDALSGLGHPAAVVGLFMPGLVARGFAGGRHPLARPGPAGGVVLDPEPSPTLFQQTGLYRLWRHLYWSDAEIDEGMASMAALLRDMDAMSRRRGAPCVFVVTGHTPAWMVHGLFEANGLDYVVVEVPREELLADGHPALRGSVRLADALEARLRKRLKRGGASVAGVGATP
jgi:hypothetical protein